MAFFSLTDIKFKTTNPWGLTGQSLGSQYGLDLYRFPLGLSSSYDLGSGRYGHYMIFNINTQTRSAYKFSESTGSEPSYFKYGSSSGALASLSKGASDILNASNQFLNSSDGKSLQNNASDLLEKLKSAAQNIAGSNETKDAIFKALEKVSGTGANSGQVLIESLKQLASGKGIRTIKRINQAVALYMPDTLAFTQQQNYGTAELGGGGFAALGALANAGTELAKGGKIEDVIGKNLTPFIGAAVARGFGNAGTAVFAASTGTVINPQIELIYTSPSLRNFRFDFMLYPRSSTEAKELQNILDIFKFHQAPEVLTGGPGGLGGAFMVPPSEFDISFHYNGKVNPNISPLSTCVLTGVDIDYAPNGFSAYEVGSTSTTANLSPDRGGTGMPVGIRLSLSFMETQIMTKDIVRKMSQETGGTVLG